MSILKNAAKKVLDVKDEEVTEQLTELIQSLEDGYKAIRKVKIAIKNICNENCIEFDSSLLPKE